VWHGSADRTVNPSNADEIVKQWLDVHELPAAPMSEATVDGYPRQIWWNADGETVIESYTITNMAHGTPLGAAENDERYGVEGAFLIEAGISSSYHIANFFGLTERARQPKESLKAKPILASAPERALEIAPALTVRAAGDRRAEPRDRPQRRAIDVSAVITRALTAAGLIR
jgi:feruloyl esterase